MSLNTIKIELLNLHPGERVLDVGCGEGRHAISVSVSAAVQVVGLDLDKADLTTARKRLADFPTRDDTSCTFIKGTGFNLPFHDNSIDKIICAEVLEHIEEYGNVLDEIQRVLKPGGIFAVSVPRFVPEWVCWKLSTPYHQQEGGHVRIFRTGELHRSIQDRNLTRFARHWAHSLHVPYWWLRCLFWESGPEHRLVKLYHRFLVWDLMQAPKVTRFLSRLLDPLMGKSVVMYYVYR